MKKKKWIALLLALAIASSSFVGADTFAIHSVIASEAEKSAIPNAKEEGASAFAPDEEEDSAFLETQNAPAETPWEDSSSSDKQKAATNAPAVEEWEEDSAFSALPTIPDEGSADAPVLPPSLAQLGAVNSAIETQDKEEPTFGLRSIINPQVKTHTYTFKNGDDVVDTQIVKNGETLLEPEAPVRDGYTFTGWYVDGKTDPIDFSQPITVNDKQEITVQARFEEVYYVFFMDGTGKDARVFKTKEGIKDATVTTDDVKLPLDSTQAVSGWYKDSALTDGPVDKYTIGDSNQQLWPKIEDGHYIYYNSGKQGSYIAPQFVAPKGTSQKPSDPKRPGYTFKHWSETENGDAYTFGNTISEDLTLYAVWEPTNTTYMVVIWKQSVQDNKNAKDAEKTYDYGESEERTAKSGTTVSLADADKNKNYTGFHYNKAKSGEVEVKGDGTTILNVYYDRNLLTIKFYKNTGNGQWLSRKPDKTMTGLYGQTLKQNGYTWPSENKWLEYYNKNYGNELPFLESFVFDNLNASTTKYLKDTLTMHDKGKSGGVYSINHYKQQLDGSYARKADHSDCTNDMIWIFSNIYTGFTVKYYNLPGNDTWVETKAGARVVHKNKDLYIRYTRNSYNLTYYNYNGVAKEEPVLYEGPLKGYANFTPERPSGLPDAYVFQGWYKDKSYSEKFDFTTEKMPANDLIIYANWAPPVVQETIYLNKEGAGTPISKELTYGEPIDPASLPTVKDSAGTELSQGDGNHTVTVPDNYKWIGWATKDGDDFIPYNFNTKVFSDITLYPYYVNNAKFTVTYEAGEGTGTAPTDSKKYAEDSSADVLAPGDLTAPDGKVFLGWKSSNTIYQPGDKIKVTGDLTLTAQWGDINTPTTLTYKANGGTGNDHVINDLANNATVTILAVGAIGITRPGYDFTGWNTKADGSGTAYAAGDEVQVDRLNADTANILYAQWKRRTVDVTANKIWNGGPSTHPTVWFKLYRATADSDSVEVPGAAILELKNGTIEVTWTGLDQTDKDSNVYTFTVKEVNAEGADFVPANYTKRESGLTVTNTRNPISIQVTKAWEDNNNQDGVRPGSVTIKLLADGEETGKTLTLTAQNNWTGTFEELDEYKAGKKIQYTVAEEVGQGYVSTITGTQAEGYKVTNHRTPEVLAVTGSKTWKDNENQDGKRPESITIRLLKNGTESDHKTVTNAEGWKWSFTNLPKYENGKLITYSITEDAVAGYSSEVKGFNVTNSYTPGKTSIQVTKAWKDGNNQDGKRPESVTIKLLADGKDTGKTIVLTEANHWTASFTDLDEYTNGQKINYTIAEIKVDQYQSSITGDATKGFVVTNSHKPNKPPIPNAPKTGEDGSPFVWLYMSLFSLSILMFLTRRKIGDRK